MNKEKYMITYLSQDVLDKLSSLPDYTTIEVVNGEIIIYADYRDLEDGCPTHHFKLNRIWEDEQEETK